MNRSISEQQGNVSASIVSADITHANLLAALHQRCFDDAWDVSAMGTLLRQPGSAARIATCRDAAGFILVRRVLDEMEILTLCVVPEARGQRLATRLLRSVLDDAGKTNVRRIFLEVAATNIVALRLYDRAGFAPVGRRAGYYQSKNGFPLDAIVLGWSPPSVPVRSREGGRVSSGAR